MKLLRRSLVVFAVGWASTAPLTAALVEIKFENLAPVTPTGLYTSPVWFGFHDGSFDFFNAGVAASAGTEAVAELGDSSLINAAFVSSQPAGISTVINNPGGPGPGLFAPGTSRTFVIDLNPVSNRYLSYAAMVVPSNDSFIGNANPLALPLFDDGGNLIINQTWTLTGAQVWDAGTELNMVTVGGAFVVGADALLSPAEGGLVHLQPLNGLDDALGQMTPAGTVIGTTLTGDPLFRISASVAVPEPGTYGLAAAALLVGLVAWRRRRKDRAESPAC